MWKVTITSPDGTEDVKDTESTAAMLLMVENAVNYGQAEIDNIVIENLN